MTKQKPVSVEAILDLAAQLPEEEQDRLADAVRLLCLRREIQKGEAELNRGEGIPGDQVIAELRERNRASRDNNAYSGS